MDRERLREILKTLPPLVPKKPRLAVASENELSPEMLREREERAQRALMEAERARVRGWQRWLKGAATWELRAALQDEGDRHRPTTDEEELEAVLAEHQRQDWQDRIDRWVEERQRIAAHERWLSRHLDPVGLGIWDNDLSLRRR
jgi:hypothetical protein